MSHLLTKNIMCRISSFFTKKFVPKYFVFLVSLGWMSHKTYAPYGQRNVENVRGNIIYYSPITNISHIPLLIVYNIITIPFAIGYNAAIKHDDILYYFNPSYYQKLIDSYKKYVKMRDEVFWASRDNQIRGGGTGVPQITYF